MQVACFDVGTGHYALDIMSVKEVINPIAITPVPHTPPFVEGIIELRGVFLPVIDLRKRLGIPIVGGDTKIVVARLGERPIGLVVDRVREVKRIDPTAIEAAPEIVAGDNARYFVGITKIDERIVLLIDLEQVLTTAERRQLGELDIDDTRSQR
jgi:purine-binding chemotaxis protein CheW